MSDPSTLTKAKLKEELKLHNISLPKSDSLKQVYVDLYKQHILEVKEDNEEEISNEDEIEVIEDQESEEEDSDDDSEIIFQTPSQQLPQKKKSNFTRKKLIQTKISSEGSLITNKKDAMAAVSVKELTDEELAAELKQFGLAPGPIMATTRSVYERKLIKYRQDRGDSVDQLEESQYDEVPDDEETSFNNPPPKPSPSRKPRLTAEGTALTRRKLASMRSEPPPEEIDRPETENVQPEQPAEPIQKSGAPIWIKFLIFAILVFFVYLVYINMEPSSGNKVPKSID